MPQPPHPLLHCPPPSETGGPHTFRTAATSAQVLWRLPPQPPLLPNRRHGAISRRSRHGGTLKGQYRSSLQHLKKVPSGQVHGIAGKIPAPQIGCGGRCVKRRRGCMGPRRAAPHAASACCSQRPRPMLRPLRSVLEVIGKAQLGRLVQGQGVELGGQTHLGLGPDLLQGWAGGRGVVAAVGQQRRFTQSLRAAPWALAATAVRTQADNSGPRTVRTQAANSGPRSAQQQHVTSRRLAVLH